MSRKTFAFAAILIFGLGTIAEGAGREIVHRTNPVYPEIAKRTNLQGIVTLKVTVGADGKVKAVAPVSGNPILSQAAVAAARQWIFAPGPEETVQVDMSFAPGQ